MNKKAAVIIVNWNGHKLLNDCLNALCAQSYMNFDVYLVDNGSKDESVNFVKSAYPQARVLELTSNTGFAYANNIGIKEALKDLKVEYIICLNNDTIVNDLWLHELVNTAELNPSIGAVSSKAYFDDGYTINNAGLEFYKVLQVNKKGGISIGYGKTDTESPELSKDCEIFAAGGVAALYKRVVVEKILKRDGEFFDEDYFAYAEDYDLGFRIRSLGYKAYLSANAHLIHLHSKTGGAASEFKAFYCERNTILTAIKNLQPIDLILFPFRNIVLKLSYLSVKNKSVTSLQSNIGTLNLVKVLLRAHLSAVKLIPKFIKKRWKTYS